MHQTPGVSRRTTGDGGGCLAAGKTRVISHDAIMIPSVYDFNLG